MVAAVVAAGCSGGGDDTSPSTDGASTTTVATSEPEGPTPTIQTTDEPTAATAAPQPTTQSTTTSTLPPPEPYRAGIVWDEPVEVVSARRGIVRWRVAPFDLGDELWVVAERWNGSVAARSLDDGLSWTEVTFAPPPESGETHITNLVRGTDGRYVAVASRATSCRDLEPVDDGSTDADDGFISYSSCRRYRPVVFVSDDGATWTESAPAGFAPPSGASLRIDDLIVVDDGYIAAGTIQGPNWRAVLFSSPDGVTWTAEREFVGDGNPMSSRSLAHDGATLVLTASETPCDTINDNTGGWVLGAGWASHGRIFVGSDIASLALQQPGEHPLAPEPLAPPGECGVIDDIPISFYPYPGFEAAVIDGTMTIFERSVPRDQRAQIEAAEDADDDELAEQLGSTIGTRRWAQLIDGEWVVTDIAGVNVPATNTAVLNAQTTIDGHPGFVEVRNIGAQQKDAFVVTDDEPAQVQSVVPLVFSIPLGATGIPGGVLVVALQAVDPFVPIDAGRPVSIVAWRSTSGEGLPVGRCDLEPDGSCLFGDLREHPDYPDFAGRDLTGVDLTGTEIGSAVFDGANLSGSTLRLVTSDRAEPPSFVGADLTGAQLQRSELGDISGATVDGASLADAEVLRADGVDFSAAVMLDARILDLTGVEFGGADLTGARLDIVDTFPDLTLLNFETIEIAVSLSAEEPVEFDLSGLDLTGVTFSGGLDPAVITGLDGTVLSDTIFRNVDLTGLDPAIDLSEVWMQFDVICPDGGEPEGFPDTCVRE